MRNDEFACSGKRVSENGSKCTCTRQHRNAVKTPEHLINSCTFVHCSPLSHQSQRWDCRHPHQRRSLQISSINFSFVNQRLFFVHSKCNFIAPSWDRSLFLVFIHFFFAIMPFIPMTFRPFELIYIIFIKWSYIFAIASSIAAWLCCAYLTEVWEKCQIRDSDANGANSAPCFFAIFLSVLSLSNCKFNEMASFVRFLGERWRNKILRAFVLASVSVYIYFSLQQKIKLN